MGKLGKIIHHDQDIIVDEDSGRPSTKSSEMICHAKSGIGRAIK